MHILGSLSWGVHIYAEGAANGLRADNDTTPVAIDIYYTLRQDDIYKKI